MNLQPNPKSLSLSHYLSHSRFLDRLSKSLILKKFQQLKSGLLLIEDQAQSQTEYYSFGEENADLKVKIIVKRSRFYSRTVFGGSIGNAESYIDQDWDTDQLSNLVRLFVLNRHLVEDLDSSLANLLSPFQKMFHGLRGNTLKGSRENIRSHYDIGNDFFKLFLDETMMYSSAMFTSPAVSLKEASLHKVKTICDKLDLKPTDHLIEIGTGWGTLAIFAAKNYGCKVTTTTISTEQFKYAQEKIKEHGLEDKITLLFEDYRLLKGTYDKLVSVEMIEAVGLNNLDVYFEKCSSLLKPNGLMCIQAITIRDQFYENAKKNVDFIQRHIFPGSGIPSIHAIMNSVTDKTDLALVNQVDFAEDYAETLKNWSQNLTKNEAEITKLGYPDFLYRLWQFYFAYCEGGFRERAIGVSQLVLTKPRYKNKSFV